MKPEDMYLCECLNVFVCFVLSQNMCFVEIFFGCIHKSVRVLYLKNVRKIVPLIREIKAYL